MKNLGNIIRYLAVLWTLLVFGRQTLLTLCKLVSLPNWDWINQVLDLPLPAMSFSWAGCWPLFAGIGAILVGTLLSIEIPGGGGRSSSEYDERNERWSKYID